MKRKLFVIYFNISLVCVLLIGAELLGQLVFFAKKGYPLFESDQHPSRAANVIQRALELHPYLVGRPRGNIQTQNENRTVTITTTDTHTRYTGAPADDRNLTRIAVLGGSTTFGTGVTDVDTWPALLQNLLGNDYSVINYGVPGYSTAEAIVQMGLIVPDRMPHIIVFYQGWNDIRNYHDNSLGPDYFNHGMSQYQTLNTLPKAGENHEPLITKLTGISALANLANRLSKLLPQPTRDQLEVSPLRYRTPDPFVDKIYSRNLNTLKTLARSLNAKAIFVPQVLNYSDFKGKRESRRWTPRIEDDALPTLLDRFNDIMEKVCAPEEKADCLVLSDMRHSEWQPAQFVDDGHLSRSGGEKFSKILAESIRKLAGARDGRVDGRTTASGTLTGTKSVQ